MYDDIQKPPDTPNHGRQQSASAGAEVAKAVNEANGKEY